MVSELAKGDWEDMRAQRLEPTLEDFDRLNQIALRLKDGAETTCANFPRVGWAGDVPFFEPTFQAFAWYYGFAVRAAANAETENTLWAFALAHAREPHFFDGLTTAEAIGKAAGAWAAKLPATREEVYRACRYAAMGFDDARPAEAGRPDADPRRRADAAAAARNLADLEKRLAAACAALHAMPADLQLETPSRLDLIREQAAIELGRPLAKDEAKLQADYDLTLREIRMRLKKERSTAEKPRDAAADEGRGGAGGAVDDEIDPPPSGRLVAGDDGAESKAGDEVVVGHGTKIVPQAAAEVNR